MTTLNYSLVEPNPTFQDQYRKKLSGKIYNSLKKLVLKENKYVLLNKALIALEDIDSDLRSEILLHPKTMFWYKTYSQNFWNEVEDSEIYFHIAFLIWLETGEKMPECHLFTNNNKIQLPMYNEFIKLNDVKNTVKVQFDEKKIIFMDSKENHELFRNSIRELEYSTLVNPKEYWVEFYLELIKPQLKNSLNVDDILIANSPEEEVLENMNKGFNMIKKYWGKMYDEVRTDLKEVFLLEPPMSSSFSDINTHGASFFVHWAYDSYWWAENVIHESSHIRMNTILANEEHLLNPNYTLANTPWREDPRPLMGVYHGCFVYSRVLLFLNKLKSNNLKVDKRIIEVYEELEEGLNILNAHAEQTSQMQKVMREMTEVLESSVVKVEDETN